MSLGKQWQVIKQNWLISVIVILLLVLSLPNLSNFSSSSSGDYSYGGSTYGSVASLSESAPVSAGEYKSVGSRVSGSKVAPEVKDRSIVKTSYLENEVKRGEFDKTAEQLKSIIKGADGFILYENVFVSGEKERDKSKHGSYNLRVTVKSYESVISQLKQLGKVVSFTENAEDITAQKVSLEDELSSEKARLGRYQQLYQETNAIEDKLNLVDRIFNEERTIAYLEKAIANVNEQVSYTEVSLRLDEKESNYAGIIFVKISDLVSAFVASLNSLLYFLSKVLPWAVAAWIVWFVARRIIRKRKQ